MKFTKGQTAWAGSTQSLSGHVVEIASVGSKYITTSGDMKYRAETPHERVSTFSAYEQLYTSKEAHEEERREKLSKENLLEEIRRKLHKASEAQLKAVLHALAVVP